jgi:hypothetical protein
VLHLFAVQKTMDQGKEYCERKINLLKSNFDELLEVCSLFLLDCSALVYVAISSHLEEQMLLFVFTAWVTFFLLQIKNTNYIDTHKKMF